MRRSPPPWKRPSPRSTKPSPRPSPSGRRSCSGNAGSPTPPSSNARGASPTTCSAGGSGCVASAPAWRATSPARSTSPSTSTTATSISRECSAPSWPGWRPSTSTTATSRRSCSTCSATPARGRSSTTPSSRRGSPRCAARSRSSRCCSRCPTTRGTRCSRAPSTTRPPSPPPRPRARTLESSGDDLYILYTGGTTGMPKGVLWRSADIYMAAMGGRRSDGRELASLAEAVEHASAGGKMRAVIGPPLMHGAAQWATFITLGIGSAVIFPDEPRRFDPHAVLTAIEREKALTCTIVGDAFARPLLDQLAKGSYDLSSLFVIGSGGAPLSTAHKREFLERIPHVTIMDSIGSSETGAQATNPSNRGTRRLDRGLPSPGGRGRRLRGPHPRARARRRRARLVRPARPRPPRLPRRRGEDRAHLPGDRRHALVGARRPRPLPARRRDRGAGARLGDDQLGRREDLRRGGGARPEAAPGGLRHRRGGPPQRALGPGGGGHRPAPRRERRRARRSCSARRRAIWRATSCPRPSCSGMPSSAARAARRTTAGRGPRSSGD